MLTRRLFHILTVVFVFLALSAAVALANPKVLLPDGSPRITGEWVFYVGPNKTPYRVFLQRGPYAGMGTYPLSGYMVSPRGVKHTFHQAELHTGNGTWPVFTLVLYEGKTTWQCHLDWKTVTPAKSVPTWRGEAHHSDTDKRQAVFTAQKKR